MFEYEIVVNDNGLPELKEIREIEVEPNTMDVEEIIYLFKMKYNMDSLDSENAYVATMDDCYNLVGIYHVSKGSYNSCNIYNRTIATFILLTRGLRFLLVHNHPGDLIEASNADKANAGLLQALANLIDVKFDGSYIITKSGYRNVNKDDVVKW